MPSKLSAPALVVVQGCYQLACNSLSEIPHPRSNSSAKARHMCTLSVTPRQPVNNAGRTWADIERWWIPCYHFGQRDPPCSVEKMHICICMHVYSCGQPQNFLYIQPDGPLLLLNNTLYGNGTILAASSADRGDTPTWPSSRPRGNRITGVCTQGWSRVPGHLMPVRF